MPKKNAYKPLLLTTTVRNPERYKVLLNVLLTYNGRVLTNKIIDKVIFSMVQQKLYVPMYTNRVPHLKSQLLDQDTLFSDENTKEIIDNSPQNHKEAGFDKGWPSRFDTFFKMAMELGFVYYEMNKPIEFSEAGLQLVKSIEPEFTHLEKQVFLNAFVKYQRINPFRKVNNNNKPLILLLQTIKELKNIYGEESAGISKLEIPLILCWRDDNAKELCSKIVEIRKKFAYTPSSEFIYEICLDLLNVDRTKGEKRFKISNIMREMPDEFIRKMRQTGLISIRGNGRFVDINNLEEQKINYVLKNYTNPPIKFSSKREYYDHMKIVDVKLVSLEAGTIINLSEKERLFNKWVSNFELSELKAELIILSKTKAYSRNEVLKYISEPVRLEFLTALALKKAYPELIVNANYVIDDEGLPISFAPGGGADIVCCDDLGNILFEVTLLTGTHQNIREMPAITRHLQDAIIKEPDSFSVLVCPHAHIDTISYASWLKDTKQLVVIILEISDFVNSLGLQNNAREYAS